jgi:hypothetical protein
MKKSIIFFMLILLTQCKSLTLKKSSCRERFIKYSLEFALLEYSSNYIPLKISYKNDTSMVFITMKNRYEELKKILNTKNGNKVIRKIYHNISDESVIEFDSTNYYLYRQNNIEKDVYIDSLFCIAEESLLLDNYFVKTGYQGHEKYRYKSDVETKISKRNYIFFLLYQRNYIIQYTLPNVFEVYKYNCFE